MTGSRAAARPPRRVALVVGLFLASGVVSGFVWELLWTPPQGVALEGSFSLTSAGLTQAFSGTALYALVGGAAGLLLGAAVALRADGAELVMLGAIALGAVGAAPVMALVGAALGPPDADEASRGQEDFTLIQQELRVEGAGAYAAYPSGALLGAGVVFLSLSRRRSGDDRGAAPGAARPHGSGDTTVASR